MSSSRLRFPAVILIAAVMGMIGSGILLGGWSPEPGFDEVISRVAWAALVSGVSVALWTILAVSLGRRSLFTWGLVGLASPLLGALILLPPVSFLVIFGAPVFSFGVGLTTGLLVGLALRIGDRSKPVPFSKSSGIVDLA